MVSPAVSHVAEYGADVSSVPIFRLSTLNCTPAILTVSKKLAVTVTEVPTTTESPPEVEVTDIVGVSEEVTAASCSFELTLGRLISISAYTNRMQITNANIMPADELILGIAKRRCIALTFVHALCSLQRLDI